MKLIAIILALLLFSSCTQTVVSPPVRARFTFELAGVVTGDTSPTFGDKTQIRRLRVPVSINVLGGDLPLEVHNSKFMGHTGLRELNRYTKVNTDYEGGCEISRNMYRGDSATCTVEFFFNREVTELGVFPFTVYLDSEQITIRFSDLQID